MIDVLYILGNGSPFKNDELRYSLRSIEKHLKNIGRVIVVGEDPGFLSREVEFHPIKEPKANKEFRIANKIFQACKKGIVQGNFLFMNDDFLFRRDVDATKYPYYHKGPLPRTNGGGQYRRALYSTYRYLNTRNLPFNHFDVHNPIIYNAGRFMAMEAHWEASRSIYTGMVVKSLYSNFYGIRGEYRADLKMSSFPSGEKRLGERDVFSYSDAGWRHGVSQWAGQNFPSPSRFEKW